MNVSLTPELEIMIQNKVRSGLYNNQSEVVREALRLLAEQDKIRSSHIDRMQAALVQGLVQADRGELVDGPGAVAKLRKGLKKRARKGG
ncbi:MAG: type II toxin-antitoxin system ParD family antitoxin [Planctomycetota bacterium]|nr:MAG: type II toxin-antitoxin system ParD family antitoxin [Planctomycetota bacterium]